MQVGAGWASRSRWSADAAPATCWSADRQPARSFVVAQLAWRAPLAATRCWASTWRALAYAADSEGPELAAGFGVGVGVARLELFLTGLELGSAERCARSARLDGTGFDFAAVGVPPPCWQPAARTSAHAAAAMVAGMLSVRMAAARLCRPAPRPE